MNNKMAIDTYLLDTYLSTNESKKQTKQTRTENHGYREHFDGYRDGRGLWGDGCRSDGIKKYKLVVAE